MTGERMAAEMAEQPDRLAALVARWDGAVAQVRALAWPELVGSVIVARGSSDAAGAYGRYLLELVSRRPVSMAAPSLHTLYGADVDYRRFLAVAVSQSGRTPEILSTLQRMQAEGAAGLAITNDGSSPLARAAQATLALEAGEERTMPATKTVTATMMAFALVAAALGTAPFTREQAAELPAWVAAVLAGPRSRPRSSRRSSAACSRVNGAVPSCAAATSANAIIVAVTVFVAGTARSSPASSASVACAARASGSIRRS